MLCHVIKSPTVEKINTPLAELRLDYFEKIDFDHLKSINVPMILTLRPKNQGGDFTGSEKERVTVLRKLAALKPAYIDLEYTLPPSLVEEIKSITPDTKIIVSYHDFDKMPPPEDILKQMQDFNADIYKMAFTLNASSEALTLLLFMKNHRNVLAMGMGPFGKATRILAPIFGAEFVYASPEQLSIDELTDIYHHDDLTPSTAIYGLIGDPVDRSPSHLTHNAIMHELGLPSVYLKFPLPQDDLAAFIALARKADIKGLSVTMPLKEKIIPLLDEVDPWAKKVGSVNTLLFKEGKIIGYNTDGKGALDAIESKMKVRGKRVIVIGAGGASKALIAEALDRGAEVLILNRDSERARQLAKKMQCQGGSLEDMCEYDILINATPTPLPIDAKWIIPRSVVMDVNIRPKETLLLQKAKEKNCTLIFGYEMFINQAVEQFRIWYGNTIDLEKTRKILEGSDYGN